MPNFQVNQVTVDELSPELREMIGNGGGGGAPAEHNHDDRYYTEAEMNAKLAEKLPVNGGTLNGRLIVSSNSPTGIEILPLDNVEGQGAEIIFGSNDNQHIRIRANHYDTLRAPFGFHLEKCSPNPQSGKAYLEVEGEIFADGNKRVYHEGYKPTPANIGAFPLAGGTLTGNINYSGTGYNGKAVFFGAGDVNGVGMYMGAGGLTVVGGGESSNTYMGALPDGGNHTTENLALLADGNIVFRAGIQGGFADAKKMMFDANGELFITSNGITFPTTGGSWIAGKTTGNVINCTGNSSGSYHPIMRYAMASGNVANLGALGDKFGFWGFLSSQTANGTNAGAYLDVATNRWTCDGSINAGNSTGNIKRTTISASNPSGGATGDVWIKYV